MFEPGSKPRYDRDSLRQGFLSALDGESPRLRALGVGQDCPWEDDWEKWLTHLFPYAVRAGFAPHHRRLWTWAWAIALGTRPHPFVAIWPRGGAKSSTAELACIALGALDRRRYVLYVSATQELADKHVTDISRRLESDAIERYYPRIGAREVSKYGISRGWAGSRLRTAAGFMVDGIGLDAAVRGLKSGDQRPDLIVVDDVDHLSDSLVATENKIATLTQSILPAGSTDVAVLGVQNLIAPNSIFSRLAGVSEHRATFLADRIVSGPLAAIEDMETEPDPENPNRQVIVRGTPIWTGQGLKECQDAIDTYGIDAFERESQQKVTARPGGMFSHLVYRHCDADEVPDLVRIEAWVDPAVTDTDQSDAHGIQIDGVDSCGILYRLYSWEQRASPEKVLVLAICKAVEYGASAVGVETNQGGDLWRSTYQHLSKELAGDGVTIDGVTYRLPKGARIPAFKSERAAGAASSKQERAGRMLVAYERDRIVHVRGTHQALETALFRFPLTKPFDLTDAAYWAWHSLADGSDLPFAWLRSNPETNAILTGNAMPVRGADPVGEALGNIAPAITNEDRIAARKAAYLASLPD